MITLDSLKTYMGISASATGRDARLTQIVNVVNALIQSRVGRQFSDGGAFQELHRGTGAPTIVLNRYPIITVTAIDDDGTAMDPTDPDVVRVWPEKGMITRTDGGVWVADIKPLYTFSYTAEIAMPTELEGAAFEIAALLFKGGGHASSRRQVGITRQMAEKALDDLPGARLAIELHSDSARGMLTGIDIT